MLRHVHQSLKAGSVIDVANKVLGLVSTPVNIRHNVYRYNKYVQENATSCRIVSSTNREDVGDTYKRYVDIIDSQIVNGLLVSTQFIEDVDLPQSVEVETYNRQQVSFVVNDMTIEINMDTEMSDTPTQTTLHLDAYVRGAYNELNPLGSIGETKFSVEHLKLLADIIANLLGGVLSNTRVINDPNLLTPPNIRHVEISKCDWSIPHAISPNVVGDDVALIVSSGNVYMIVYDGLSTAVKVGQAPNDMICNLLCKRIQSSTLNTTMFYAYDIIESLSSSKLPKRRKIMHAQLKNMDIGSLGTYLSYSYSWEKKKPRDTTLSKKEDGDPGSAERTERSDSLETIIIFTHELQVLSHSPLAQYVGFNPIGLESDGIIIMTVDSLPTYTVNKKRIEVSLLYKNGEFYVDQDDAPAQIPFTSNQTLPSTFDGHACTFVDGDFVRISKGYQTMTEYEQTRLLKYHQPSQLFGESFDKIKLLLGNTYETYVKNNEILGSVVYQLLVDFSNEPHEDLLILDAADGIIPTRQAVVCTTQSYTKISRTTQIVVSPEYVEFNGVRVSNRALLMLESTHLIDASDLITRVIGLKSPNYNKIVVVAIDPDLVNADATFEQDEVWEMGDVIIAKTKEGRRQFVTYNGKQIPSFKILASSLAKRYDSRMKPFREDMNALMYGALSPKQQQYVGWMQTLVLILKT